MVLSRRRFLQSSPALLARSAEGASTDIGGRKQLFIDRRLIASSTGIGLTMNPPRKAGPVLLPSKPWEKDHIGSYLSVVEDQGICKMWYMSFGGKGGGRLCYATSADGIHWERPSVGAVEFQGSRENNIAIGRFREGAVMLDPVAPPQQRFKTLASYGDKRPSALGTSTRGTLMLMTSPDGIHWDREFPVLPFHPDSMNCLFWDQRLEKYVAYLRGWNPLRVVLRAEIPRDRILRTWPYTRIENPRYLWRVFDWGRQWPPTLSREYPTVISADALDPPGDIYTPNVQPYPWAEDAYFAFPSFFRHTAPPGTEKIPMAGVLDVQFFASRDGIHFVRFDRRPYVGRGFPGDYDSHNLYMGLGMIRRGSEIYQYYGGGSADHAATGPAMSALMRVVQRLDGFVSADAGARGGEITTPPLVFQGRSLRLNADSSASGTVRVEIVGAPGFELANCEPVITNDVACEVKWKAGADVSALQGQLVRLRFAVQNAKLYAFQFVDAG